VPEKVSIHRIFNVLALIVKISISYRKMRLDDPRGLTEKRRRYECDMTHFIVAQIV
jgi:hypothetical protein